MTTEETEMAGESTETWAFREAGFMGTIKQLTHCARCGEPLPHKSYDEPRHVFDVLKPTMHTICDDCFEEMPE